jgi:glutamate dehydrogenase
MARASLRDDFHAVHAALTAQVLSATDEHDSAENRVAAWESADAVVVQRATTTLDEILNDDEADLARLSVGLRVIRTMLTTP